MINKIELRKANFSEVKHSVFTVKCNCCGKQFQANQVASIKRHSANCK